MNIVYVYNREWPSKIPGINFCTFTGYGLSQVSLDVNVNLIVKGSREEKYQKSYKEILREYFSLDSVPNFELEPIGNKLNGKLTNTRFYWIAVNKILKLNNVKDVDIIITRNTNFLPYLFLVKKLTGAKVFFEAHHYNLDNYFREKKIYKINKKKYLLQKIFLPKIDGIICLQYIQKELYERSIPEQRYCLARTGLKSVHKDNQPWNNNYIGYVGSLHKSKGVQELLYAFQYLKNTDLELLIVGGKKEKEIEKMKELAFKLGISHKVIITGWVNRSRLEKYLEQIKIGIVPAEDNFYNRYITSPVKIFDYSSYGIPTIGSDLPTIREIVTDKGGLFYKKGDTTSLAKSIKTLNSSKELYDSYSKFIKKRAEELTWENRGKKLISFFEEVVQSSTK
ncbi:MAG: glycosyltransferase family 4 protein [Firmicutes bacterium]|nr:glycosyltransferase family 4 protein [Bacillota bacterium]